MTPTRRTLAGWFPVIEYCAEEVRRQYAYTNDRTGPLAVGWMINAWWIALLHEGPVTADLIVRLGHATEPHKNDLSGFRNVGVMVGGRVCPAPLQVPRLIDLLIDSPLTAEPEEFYLQYELIHPFRDGNGRTGKVLFNLLNGTLLDPQWPRDNFGGIGNP